ncbi:MAG: PEP-CTERM system TPR-repeat protein PrsT [Alphaproteobacteria bacterium]|nr:PEP-CTERM system TPR-repeat protein PrsT [Alphaproteobacteria bacterium]
MRFFPATREFTAVKSVKASLCAGIFLATTSGPLVAQDTTAISDLLSGNRFDDAIEAIEKLHSRGEASAESYLQLAQAYMETGAGIAAEAAIERARRLGADYARTAVPFAKSQLLQGKYAEAIGALRGVIIPNDMRAAAAIVLGDANFALSKYGESDRQYHQAREIDQNNYQAMLGLARLALQKQDLALAADYATDAAEVAPDNTMVQYTLGMIARYRGEFVDAEAYFQRALDLFPENLLANIELASLKVDQNRTEEAQIHLDAIYAVAPRHPMAQYLSGAILASQERYEEAAVLLNNARTVTENYLPATFVRGLVSYQLGQDSLAESLLTKVHKAKPGNLPAKLALAGIYLRQKQPQRALDILKAVIAPDAPINAEALAIAAAATMQLGRTEEGERLYQRLSDAGSDQETEIVSNVPAKLALAKFVSGQKQAGISAMAEVVSNNAADVRSLAILGEMQMREKDIDGAAITIEKIIQIAPQRALGYNMKGSLAYARGEFVLAQQSFSQAYDRNPQYFTALRNRALVRIRLENLGGAEADLKGLLEQSPNDARAKAILGRVLLMLGRAEEAVDYFNDAVRAIPNSVDVWADYSEALAGAGKTSDAISQAKDTAVMAADRPDILRRMGLLLLGLDEARVAVRPLSRFVAFNPDNGEAHLLLGRALLATRLYTGAKSSFLRAEKAGGNKPDGDLINWYIFASDSLGERYDQALVRLPELVDAKRPADVRPSVVGDLMLASGRIDEAIIAYRAALKVTDTSGLAIGLANALDASGEKFDAVRVLENFVDRNPANRDARMALGTRYQQTGRQQAATAQYEAILRSGVADAQVAALLAKAYMELGNRNSIPLIERAYLIRPEDPFILDAYGWIMLQARRDTSAAIDALQKATRRAPAVAGYKFHLGMAYLARGQRQEALKEFQDALRLDPDFPDAGEAKRQIGLLN